MTNNNHFFYLPWQKTRNESDLRFCFVKKINKIFLIERKRKCVHEINLKRKICGEFYTLMPQLGGKIIFGNEAFAGIIVYAALRK